MKIPQNSHQAPSKHPSGFHEDRGVILGSEVVENYTQGKFSGVTNAPLQSNRKFKAVLKNKDSKTDKVAEKAWAGLRHFFPGHKHK